MWILDATCPVVLTVTAQEWDIGTLRNQLLTLEESEALLTYAYLNAQRLVPHEFVLAVVCSTSSKAKGLLQVLIEEEEEEDEEEEEEEEGEATSRFVAYYTQDDRSSRRHQRPQNHMVKRDALLHYACANRLVDPQSVEMLLQCWPESIHQRHDQYMVKEEGWLPLHVAANAAASVEVVRLLLAADKRKDAAQQMTTEQRLPIQILWHCLRTQLVNGSGQLLPHGLARNGWEVALELINAYPEAAKLSFAEDIGDEEKDMTLLAMFASLPGSLAVPPEIHLAVLQRLYEVCPQAIQTPVGWTRELPLHLAVRTAPSEVTQFLVDCWPQACATPDAFGTLPLHEACNYPFRSLQTCKSIQILLAAHPDAAKVHMMTNDRRFPPLALHLWCASTRLEVRNRTQRGDNDEVAVEVGTNDEDDNDMKRATLQALLAAHPASAHKRPYPLLILLQRGMDQVYYDVRIRPSSHQNAEHYILRDACFLELLQAHPRALLDGQETIAQFFSFRWSPSLAKIWIQAAYPQGLHICDPVTHRLPLYDLCQNHSHEEYAEHFLPAFHDLHPEGTSCPDEEGHLALHLALTNKNNSCTWPFLWELIRSYTPALTMPDFKGRVPFVIACGNPKSNLSVLFSLLRESPHILMAFVPLTNTVTRT